MRGYWSLSRGNIKDRLAASFWIVWLGVAVIYAALMV